MLLGCYAKGVTMDISKSDWKLFRQRVPEWQERYMEQLIKEYVELLNSKEAASELFWTLEKRIRMDKRHPGVRMELRKSNAIWDIAGLIRQNVIAFDDLEEFSEELQEKVHYIIAL